MKSYLIHLIRHGTCQGNLEGRYIGTTDSPLAPRGTAELEKLCAENEYPYAAGYICSPCSRCTETMKILYPDLEYATDDGFRECSFGQWENQTAEQLQSDPEFLKWVESGQNAAPPGGETGAVFMHRVCVAFENLVSQMMRTGQTSTVLITHAGVIMTILTAYGLPKAKFYDWMCESGHGYSLRITPSLWMRDMVAEVYQRLPIVEDEPQQREYTVMDAARYAADKAFGGSPEDGEEPNE